MFPFFPYSNFHRLNADWILLKVKELATTVGQVAEEVASWAARVTQAETDAAAALADAENAVRYTSQNLNTGERRVACTNIHAVNYDSTPLQTADAAQARQNIGAADATGLSALGSRVSDAEDRIGGLEDSRVSYAAPQSLTDAQKTQARANIGAVGSADLPDVSDVVRTSAQSLTDAQKTQARANIGAVGSADLPDVSDVLRYSSQSLTTGQKSQARENIGAADGIVVEELEDVIAYNIIISETATDVFSIIGGNLDDARTFADRGVVIITLITLLNGVIRGVANFSDLTNAGEISAVLTEPLVPGPGISIGYRVLISNNGTNDVLIVTSFEYKLMPSCTSSDRGKVLTVASTGQPVWEDKGPLVVTFSGNNDTSDAVCDVPYNTLLSAINTNKLVVVNYHGTGTNAGVSINNLEFTIDSSGFALSRIDNFGAELTITYNANTLSIEFYN